MKRLVLPLALSVSALVSLAANDGAFVFSDQIMEKLDVHKRVVRVNKEPGIPEMLPNNDVFVEFMNERILDDCKLSFESIYILDVLTSRAVDESEDEYLKRVLTAIMDLESLEGIEYYSETSKKKKILYEESKFLEDKPEEILFDTEGLFSAASTVMQKDSSFGENIYRYTWLSDKEIWAFSSLNETPLSYGIIRAAPTHGFLNVIGIFRWNDTLVLYAFSAIKTASFLPGFMVKRVQTSLVHRMDALKSWFENQLILKKAD